MSEKSQLRIHAPTRPPYILKVCHVFCGYTAWFMLDPAGNPKDLFSCDIFIYLFILFFDNSDKIQTA